jgi:hypothetical protein
MRVASAYDSTSSAMMSSGFCVFSTPSRIGMSGASLAWDRKRLPNTGYGEPDASLWCQVLVLNSSAS